MDLSLNTLSALLRLTFQDAREGAHAVLSLGVPRSALFLMVATVAVLSALMAGIFQLLVPQTVGPPPGVVAITIGGVILGTAIGLHYAGRAFGGTGELSDAIVLMVWLQVVLLLIQAMQNIVLLVAPGAVGIVFLLAFGYTLWLMINFIDVLHNFKSRARAAVLLLLTLVGLSVGLGMIFSILGISVPGATT
ncbi:MAG: YIP1 family protein [Pseudomonadota bacterium]